MGRRGKSLLNVVYGLGASKFITVSVDEASNAQLQSNINKFFSRSPSLFHDRSDHYSQLETGRFGRKSPGSNFNLRFFFKFY